MSEQTCQCGKPTAGAWLCDDCEKTLAYAVANISAYYGDLDRTIRPKRVRYSSEVTKGSIGKEQPLVVDGRFVDPTGRGSRLDWETRNTISTWARAVMDDQPELNGPACIDCLHVSCSTIRRRRFPRDTVPSMCAYLHRQLRWIVREQWAEQILDELLDLEKRLCWFVDRPADRWYAGKCSSPTDDGAYCSVDLYAETDSGTIKCRGCGTQHDVGTRRDFLLDEAKAYNVTATEAAGALLAWTDYDGSEEKLVDRIRKWDERGKLERRGQVEHLGKDRALYRLGDIQDLLVQHAQREQERRMQRAG